MKKTIKKQIYAVAFLCISCAVPLKSMAPNPEQQNQLVQDYTNPAELMRDFLDTTKRPDAKIHYWARQFLLLFQKDPKMKDFCMELKDAVRYKNVNRIASLFICYKDKFSEELRTHLLAKGLPVVREILEKRVKK